MAKITVPVDAIKVSIIIGIGDKKFRVAKGKIERTDSLTPKEIGRHIARMLREAADAAEDSVQ